MNEINQRPDPEALLSTLESERRGALKVFLGAVPGVGKTYKMLEAAREARREGADVVIGVVESHGRKETEVLCEGLEVVPLMPVDYRGTRFLELDRAEITQCRVPSPRVVEAFDVVEHVRPGIVSRPVELARDALGFQRREEALHRRIVPDVARSAHRAGDTVLSQQFLEVLAGILAALFV